MKITPKKGYVLVSHFEISEQKKSNVLILPGDEKKKTYLKIESNSDVYTIGEYVITKQYNSKMQIEENLFLIAEEDIIASVVLEEPE